jgi:hypothetical protein
MRKRLSEEDVINAWLFKYHGITVDELVKNEPELCKTPAWFKKYAITQDQYDEWYKWFISALQRDQKCSKKSAQRHSWSLQLNLAPSIIKDKE